MKPIKHFNYGKKRAPVTLKGLMPRFVFFSIFIILAALCFAADSLLGFGGGVILALAATGATTDSLDTVLDNFKNEIKKFDLTDPATVTALKNAFGEDGLKKALLGGSQNGISELSGKLGEFIDEMKNAARPAGIPQGGENKIWCHGLLTERERTSTDKEELNRLGMNRYIRTLVHAFKGSADPELLKAVREINAQRHDLQTAATAGEGGNLVPSPLMQLIVDAIRENGIWMRDTTIVRMNSGYAKFPVLAATGHPAPAFKKEAETANVRSYTVGNLVFGYCELKLKDNGMIIPWTAELDRDSISDIGALIKSYAGEYFGIYGDDILFRGNGQAGGDQIKGLYNLAAYQSVETTGQTFDTVDIDNIIDADALLRTVDRPNVKRYMSPTVWALFKKMKDAQQRYKLDSQERINNVLEGKAVIETDSAYATSESGAAKPFITMMNPQRVYVGLQANADIQVLMSNVATWTDGAKTRNAFQENLLAIRLNMPFDITVPFESRIIQVKTKA